MPDNRLAELGYGNRWQRTRDNVLARGGGYQPTDTSNASGMNALEMLALSPTIAGSVASGVLAGRDFGEGNYASGGLNALAAIPVIGWGGRIAETMYRGAKAGEHMRPGGFWSTSRHEAEGFARRAGDTGSVREVPGFGGRTFGGIGEPVTIQDWLNVAEGLAKHNGPEAAEQFARGIPLTVDVGGIEQLRRIAASHGALTVAEGPEAGLALMQLRNLTGVNGANEALRAAGYGSVRYGRDAQLLDPATALAQ